MTNSSTLLRLRFLDGFTPTKEQSAKAISVDQDEVIISNHANSAMAGYAKKPDATMKAAETIDASQRGIADAIRQVDNQILSAANNGSIEQMPEKNKCRLHTINLANFLTTMIAMFDKQQPMTITGQSPLPQ